MSKIANSVDTESKLVVPKELGEGIRGVTADKYKDSFWGDIYVQQ